MTRIQTYFIYKSAVVVKLLLLFMINIEALGRKPEEKFLIINLSGRNDVKEACTQLTSGKTKILAIGRLLSSFILLTTDLLLFELPHKLVDPSLNPPYYINVDQTPTHFKNRYPNSYQSVEAIADRITSAFTVAIKDLSSASLDREYLAFAYENRAVNGSNPTGCLLVVDLRTDKVASSGLCDDKLTDVVGISNNLAEMAMAFYVTDTEMCFANLIAFLTEEKPKRKKAKKDYEEEPCTSLEQSHCKVLHLIEQRLVPELPPQLLSDWCINLKKGISTAGYRDNKQQALFVVDSSGTVTQMKQQEGSLKLLISDMHLDRNFIACNYRPPIVFQLTQKKGMVVLVMAAVLQLLICLVLYYACKSTQGSARATGGARDGRKQKSRKKKRSLSSKKSKSSLKSRSSVSSGGKSVSARKSISGRASVSLGSSPSRKSRKSRISERSMSRKSGRRSSGFSQVGSSVQSPRSKMSSFSRKSSGGVRARSSKQMSV